MEYIMLNSINDPYLDTVRRSLRDKEYKNRKNRQKERESQEKKTKSFFAQEIRPSDYINLSESSINTIFISSFIFIPYITGIIFIFFVIARANLKTFNEINIDEHFVYWSIGYEVLAFISIILIIKSAINFQRR
jgi:hypothetical protein